MVPFLHDLDRVIPFPMVYHCLSHMQINKDVLETQFFKLACLR